MRVKREYIDHYAFFYEGKIIWITGKDATL